MLKYTVFGVHITITNKPGIYILDGNSATGKTRLFKLLRELSRIDKSILTYTRRDETEGIPFPDHRQGIELVIIDRFSTLANKHEELITRLAENAVVLLDCKHDCPFEEFEGCIMHMEDASIDVMI